MECSFRAVVESKGLAHVTGLDVALIARPAWNRPPGITLAALRLGLLRRHALTEPGLLLITVAGRLHTASPIAIASSPVRPSHSACSIARRRRRPCSESEP